ncbi:hypothetical protein Tsubulata_040555 [Turnera subulata]|uniref:Uncharacterized protein n=1 Tax=Turnera subulata TaxID=218843 RepID=A0A9Q0FBX8_9ROSI|nr:hypothetical protein Tsubulata_040555 [Turnera subulata]
MRRLARHCRRKPAKRRNPLHYLTSVNAHWPLQLTLAFRSRIAAISLESLGKAQLEEAITQSTIDESIIAPNDVVGRILGQEHSGRVRCLRLGVVPSACFKHPRVENIPVNAAGNDVNPHSPCDAKIKGICDALKSYFITKEGQIPDEFAGILSNPTVPSDASSGPSTPADARKSSHASTCAATTSANDENNEEET